MKIESCSLSPLRAQQRRMTGEVWKLRNIRSRRIFPPPDPTLARVQTIVSEFNNDIREKREVMRRVERDKSCEKSRWRMLKMKILLRLISLEKLWIFWTFSSVLLRGWLVCLMNKLTFLRAVVARASCDVWGEREVGGWGGSEREKLRKSDNFVLIKFHNYSKSRSLFDAVCCAIVYGTARIGALTRVICVVT